MADEKQAGQGAGGAATAEDTDDSVLSGAVNKAREKREESIPFEVISEKPLPKSCREVVIEVPRSEWEPRLQEFFKEVKPNAAMEGFRKGKVPMKLLQRRFTREASSQLVERVTPNIVRDYEKQKGDTVYGVPSIVDFNVDGDGPVKLTLQLEVKPVIDPTDYLGVEVEVPEAKLEDEMVDRRVEELRQHAASFEEADKELGDDDAVVVDIQAVDGKGLTVVQEANKMYQHPHDELPHKVVHELFGKKAGETVETTDVGPDGKGELRYTVTIKSVKALKLPELDDEFAKDLGNESLEDMRQKVRDQLQGFVDKMNKDEAFERLVDKLVSQHEFEVPPALKAHVERDIARQDYLYMNRTGMTPPRLRNLTSRSQYQEELDRAAEQRVKGFLLLDAIGRKEDVQANDDDVNAALEEQGQQEGRKGIAIRAALEKRKELGQFTEQVRFNKVRDFLLSKTTVKYVEAPKVEEDSEDAEGENVAGEAAAEPKA